VDRSQLYSAKKKTRSVPSAGKVMALRFWDAEGILFIDYLEKGKKNNWGILFQSFNTFHPGGI
jgi:hypothetical protein